MLLTISYKHYQISCYLPGKFQDVVCAHMHSPTCSLHCLRLPLFSRLEVILQVIFVFFLKLILFYSLCFFTLHYPLLLYFRASHSFIFFYKGLLKTVWLSFYIFLSYLISCIKFAPLRFSFVVSMSFKKYLLKMCQIVLL